METPVKPIAQNTLHICSAAEALALLRKHGGHGSAAFMRSLADAVSDENNHITGTVGDFNNLIDRFEALGDYFDALRVCDFALKIYPRSATLLAITLNTCARSGADGETYLAAAEKTGTNRGFLKTLPSIAAPAPCAARRSRPKRILKKRSPSAVIFSVFSRLMSVVT